MFLRSICTLLVCSGTLLSSAVAGDLRIPLPRRSTATPVQKLNRDGVEAIKKRALSKAKKLFYDAYLLDPDDPFTLNNLGYVAELEGSVDRAQRFYELAKIQTFEAHVDMASRPGLKGKTIAEAAGAGDREMQSNRSNLEAMRLLQSDRIFEAEEELQGALRTDPKNPFTLNNLGLVKEKGGDLRGALESYYAASRLNSDERVIVSTDKDARGKKISDLAEHNADRIEKRLSNSETSEQEAARLTFQGVREANHNNIAAARRNFQQALRLNPNDAFVLNNMGYLSELEGDQETAQFYYSRAQSAEETNRKVSAATRPDAIGLKMGQLATDNDTKVDTAIVSELKAKRRERKPIQLKRRDNTLVEEPQQPPTNQTEPR